MPEPPFAMRFFASVMKVMAGEYRWCVLALAMLGWLGLPVSSHAATLVVTSLANSGAGSLRAALTNASNGDVITFAVTGTITNTTTYDGLTISNNVSIVGPGANVLSITGTNRNRAFYINSGVTVTLSGLTFTECYGGPNLHGGAIFNAGNLMLSNCVFTACRSTFGGISLNNGGPGYPAGNGGAIFNSGTLAAVNCQFLNNSASAGGGGADGGLNPYPDPISPGGNGGNGGNGGAVYSLGTAGFTNCTFASNSSGSGGSGGAGGSGTHSLSGPGPGPGLRGGNGGAAGNGSAVFGSSGVTFVSCTFFNNTTGSGGHGGNGGNGFGHTFPNSNTFPGGNGGAAGYAGSGTLYCTGACQLVACTFYNNSAGSGGNGGSGGAGVNNVSIPGGNGGNGGNAGDGGSGGGIYGPRTNVSFTLQNVLIAQNTAGYAGAAGSAGAGGSGPIVGSNGLPGTNAVDGTGPDLSGKFISQKHNLVGLSDGSTGFTNGLLGDIVGTGAPIDPMISALNNNGGLVSTCALLPGSPAMDAGDDTLIGAPLNLTKDARGYARKAGAQVDIGAYEYQFATLPITGRTAVTVDGLRVTVTNTPGAVFTVLGTTDLTLPIESWEVLGQMTESVPGQFEWLNPDYANYESRFFRVRSP